jgi:methylmalonyl-CoA mutase N-terminal domain/subunit
MFTGFPEATIQFFLGLRFNNHVTFFEEHKEEYLQNVQAPFYAFIEEIAPHMQEIDSGMEVRPSKCLARIRRERDPHRHAAALERVRQMASSGENIMPALIEAAHAYATLGEITGVLRSVFGVQKFSTKV